MAGFVDDDENIYRKRKTEKPESRCGLETIQIRTTGEWIKRGIVFNQVTTDMGRILDAVEFGFVDRHTAAEFVLKTIGYREWHKLAHGVWPDRSGFGVRPDWKRIPRRSLGRDELALSDMALSRMAPPQEIDEIKKMCGLDENSEPAFDDAFF